MVRLRKLEPDYDSSESAPLTTVVLHWEIGIGAGHSAQVTTGDWDLLHSLADGSYELTVNGKYFHLRAGDILYYPPRAEVVWLRNEGPVTFHSLGFTTRESGLPAGPRQYRRPELAADLTALVRRWLDGPAVGAERLQRWSLLTDLLARLVAATAPAAAQEAESLAARWERLEAHLRHSGDWHMPTAQMARWLGCSRSTLHRACLAATGQSPGTRLRALRHDLARQLLTSTAMSVTAVSEELGYGRLQEFSREFRSRAGTSPSSYRSSGGSQSA